MNRYEKEKLLNFKEWFEANTSEKISLEDKPIEKTDEQLAEDLLEERRKDAIKKYRRYIACDDDFVITPDNIEEWALRRTSAEDNIDYDHLKELLCK